METNYSLKERVFTDLIIHISPEVKKISLNINASVVFGKPVDEDSKSGLIRPTFTLQAENPDEFNVSISEILIYEFDEKPEDVEAELRKIYEQEGPAYISDVLDSVLNELGKQPINIKQFF